MLASDYEKYIFIGIAGSCDCSFGLLCAVDSLLRVTMGVCI